MRDEDHFQTDRAAHREPYPEVGAEWTPSFERVLAILIIPLSIILDLELE
jgi:hypothetical protein